LRSGIDGDRVAPFAFLPDFSDFIVAAAFNKDFRR
jgi:hypothetical protein